MKISFLILFNALIISTSAFGQFIYYDKLEKIDSTELNEMYIAGLAVKDSIKELGLVAVTFEINEVANKVLMTIDGRLDVFEWINGDWINLYSGSLHGYNQNSQKFVYRNKLFSYRGYGFWRVHGEVIEFLIDRGEWEIIPDSKNLPFGIGLLRDSILSINSDDCYNVNLYSQRAKKTRCDYWYLDEFPTGYVYSFEDYLLVGSVLEDGSHFPVLDKESGLIYTSNRQPFSELRRTHIDNSLIYINGNDLKIISKENAPIVYNVNDELKNYFVVPVRNNFIVIILAMISIMAIVSIVFFVKKKSSPHDNNENLESLFAFKDHFGMLIDADELDSILRIDTITVYETRKHKRASLIKDLNSLSKINYGTSLIVREKDPSDKRFYLYRIQKL